MYHGPCRSSCQSHNCQLWSWRSAITRRHEWCDHVDKAVCQRPVLDPGQWVFQWWKSVVHERGMFDGFLIWSSYSRRQRWPYQRHIKGCWARYHEFRGPWNRSRPARKTITCNCAICCWRKAQQSQPEEVWNFWFLASAFEFLCRCSILSIQFAPPSVCLHVACQSSMIAWRLTCLEVNLCAGPTPAPVADLPWFESVAPLHYVILVSCMRQLFAAWHECCFPRYAYSPTSMLSFHRLCRGWRQSCALWQPWIIVSILKDEKRRAAAASKRG